MSTTKPYHTFFWEWFEFSGFQNRLENKIRNIAKSRMQIQTLGKTQLQHTPRSISIFKKKGGERCTISQQGHGNRLY